MHLKLVSLNHQGRPHALTSIAGTYNGVANPTFAYDANGAMTSGAGRTATANYGDQLR